jgi:hypothetical protein
MSGQGSLMFLEKTGKQKTLHVHKTAEAFPLKFLWTLFRKTYW